MDRSYLKRVLVMLKIYIDDSRSTAGYSCTSQAVAVNFSKLFKLKLKLETQNETKTNATISGELKIINNPLEGHCQPADMVCGPLSSIDDRCPTDQQGPSTVACAW